MPREAARTGLIEARPSSGPNERARRGPLWLHASCVELSRTGVVLLGPSGSGKSDLALRLIDAGGRLVADDRLAVEREGEQLFGRPAAALAGLLEVRGFGIVRLPYGAVCRLGFVVDLDPNGRPERLPEAGVMRLLGIGLPRLWLDPTAPSACARIRVALAAERVHPSPR
jgi:serine kinase of HPr protein (carbohydrate metabolism regulator)